MEEVAVIVREIADFETAKARVWENLTLVRDLSDHWEWLPGLNEIGPSGLEQEDPDFCLGRVIQFYDRTLFAEENERFQMSFKTAETFD